METKPNTVMGLDVGSSEICAVICEMDAASEVQIKGIGKSVSSGIKRGRIEDINELRQAIDRTIKKAEHAAGCAPVRIMTNIPLSGVRSEHHTGVVRFTEATSIINEDTRLKCLRRSKDLVTDRSKRVLHLIPMAYRVDGNVVDTPVGKSGEKLEADVHLVLGDAHNYSWLIQSLAEFNFTVGGIVLGLLAQAEVVLTEADRKQGAVVVDIGGRFTSVGIFKDNILVDSMTWPIGGETFTSDVAQCLNVSILEAERLKLLFGDVQLSRVEVDKTIEVNAKSTGRERIKRLFLCQILEARAHELVQLIAKRFSDQLHQPFKLALCGGGSLLKGLDTHFESEFKRPLSVGIPHTIQALLEKSTESTALGLVLFGIKTKALTFVGQSHPNFLSRFKFW